MNFFEFLPLIPKLPNAKCRDIEDANIFFPESRAEERKSLPTIQSICGGCIDRKECLDYALKEQISYGIWAGTTPAQRGFGQGFKHRFTGKVNRAEAIRSLSSLGRTPKEIAATLKVELAYVTQVIKRAAKLEGESQLLNEIKPSGESSSSSESQC